MRYRCSLLLPCILTLTATTGEALGGTDHSPGRPSAVLQEPARGITGRAAPGEWLQKGACPFECCRYGNWTARRPLAVVDSPTPGARPVADIAPGTVFAAVTGQTHTIAGIFRFSRPVGPFAAGDRVSVYDYLGEGFYRAWVEGGMQEIELLTAPPGVVFKGSMGAWEVEPVQTWWVRVRLANGIEGWLEIADSRTVDGNDACG